MCPFSSLFCKKNILKVFPAFPPTPLSNPTLYLTKFRAIFSVEAGHVPEIEATADYVPCRKRWAVAATASVRCGNV